MPARASSANRSARSRPSATNASSGRRPPCCARLGAIDAQRFESRARQIDPRQTLGQFVARVIALAASSLRSTPSVASCPPRYQRRSPCASTCDVTVRRGSVLRELLDAVRIKRRQIAARARSPDAAAGAASSDAAARVKRLRRAFRCRRRREHVIARPRSRACGRRNGIERAVVAANRGDRGSRRRATCSARCASARRAEQRCRVEHEFVELVDDAVESWVGRTAAGMRRAFQPPHSAAQRFARQKTAESPQRRVVGAPQVVPIGQTRDTPRRSTSPRPARQLRQRCGIAAIASDAVVNEPPSAYFRPPWIMPCERIVWPSPNALRSISTAL